VKKYSYLTLLVTSSFIASCGLIDRWKSPSEEAVSSVENSDAKSIDSIEAAPEINVAEDKSSEAPVVASDVKDTHELEQIAKEVSHSEMPTIKVNEPVEKTMAMSGNMKTYQVKKGETLMQVAFKVYGDISRWKDFAKYNPNLTKSQNVLKENFTLKYEAPIEEFVWNPTGEPYMIKNGETLGIISSNVYQTPKKWKNIWENNKPLIKNPNKIYAGFTLYYLQDSSPKIEIGDHKAPEKNDQTADNRVPSSLKN
jgi:nucleoid-associated protein YgaU